MPNRTATRSDNMDPYIIIAGALANVLGAGFFEAVRLVRGGLAEQTAPASPGPLVSINDAFPLVTLEEAHRIEDCLANSFIERIVTAYVFARALTPLHGDTAAVERYINELGAAFTDQLAPAVDGDPARAQQIASGLWEVCKSEADAL